MLEHRRASTVAILLFGFGTLVLISLLLKQDESHQVTHAVSSFSSAIKDQQQPAYLKECPDLTYVAGPGKSLDCDRRKKFSQVLKDLSTRFRSEQFGMDINLSPSVPPCL
jgi:hypothetical protein